MRVDTVSPLVLADGDIDAVFQQVAVAVRCHDLDAQGLLVLLELGLGQLAHARLTRLPAAARPSSRTPSFTAGWAQDGADAALLARTIHRWRHQLR